MAYTPTTWVTGDTITATKLNKLEQGVSNAGGGGYDAEIRIYHDNNSNHDYECTIVSGSFASLYAMLQDNISPIVLVRMWDEMNNIKSATTAAPIYSYTSNAIAFALKVPYQNSLGTYSNEWRSMIFSWSSSDVVTC